MILSKTIKEILQIASFYYDENTKKWSQTTIKSLNIDFDGNDYDLNNNVLTHENQNLVVYHRRGLYYLDCLNGTVQTSQNLNGFDTFIKSTNLINGQKKLFYHFENTNDFIGLNNMKQLVYVEYIKDKNKIQIITSTNDKSRIVKIGLFKHILFAFCEQNHELYVYNLKSFNKKDAFNNPIFKQLFPDNSLQFACISDDCEYLATVEIPKMLSLYRLSDCKRIAHVPLYNEINSILMSDHYVVMGMQDKRILSYLIVDPLKSDHENRIAALDSR